MTVYLIEYTDADNRTTATGAYSSPAVAEAHARRCAQETIRDCYDEGSEIHTFTPNDGVLGLHIKETPDGDSFEQWVVVGLTVVDSMPEPLAPV